MKKIFSVPSVFGLMIMILSVGWPIFSQAQAARRARLQQSFQGDPVAAVQPLEQAFNIEGVKRTALIYPNANPAPESGAPLVFVFHGHGGTAKNAAKKFQIHLLWPEAVVVYMQGIPGVEGITDPDGSKNGWQKDPGELNDRDIKFFDAALAGVEAGARIDPNRVFVLGHSNGGRFANVLWHERGVEIAAVCSASGQGGALIPECIPRSIMIVAGEEDPLVSYQSQTASVVLARRLLQTNPDKATKQGYVTLEPGATGLELATYLHPGGHEFPKPALKVAVEFFKRQHLN
ncbi:MAG: esterase [Blastocatellia bacterium]|nr:esterase [Blastocatellia bacterium]